MTNNAESNPPVAHRPSWWTTLPGLITAIAGFLAAVATLVPALKGAGLIGQPEFKSPLSIHSPDSVNPAGEIQKNDSTKEHIPTQQEIKIADSSESKSTINQTKPSLVISADVLKRTGVSDKVKGLVVALKDSSGNSRETALKTLRDSIPENLNSQEASILLKNTEGSRTNSIAIIAGNIASNQDGDDLALILGDTEGNNREVALRSLKKEGKIKKQLLPQEAKAILNNMSGNRTNAIGILADNLAVNLNGNDVDIILGDVEGNNREVSIKSLVKAGVIKDNLLAKEANVILKNTGGNRTNAIAILSENLAPNLNGEEVAVILGDTEGNNREVSLKSLSKANKIKSNLQASEAVAILKNTGNNRVNAIGVIARNLSPNQNGEEISSILGDAEGNNREVALKSLIKAEKIKTGLQAGDLEPVLKGMSTPTGALKDLAPFIAR